MGNEPAFTLAETLITLGIVGIVAAMTMPSLVSNYRKKLTETKLKSTYSILLNAISSVSSESNIPFSRYYAATMHPDECPMDTFPLYYCANVLFKDFIKNNNVKILKEFDNNLSGWFNNYISNVNDDGEIISAVYHGKWFILANGCPVGIYNGVFYVITDNFSTHRKIKLIGGKNFFQFGTVVTTYEDIKKMPSGLVPLTQAELGRYSTREKLRSACKSHEIQDSVNKACTQLFINDGLKFADDYPIKF